jgi:nicotinamide-nucleotide amidase
VPDQGIDEAQLGRLAQQVIGHCSDRGVRLVLAESLTGGMAASALVAVPGASAVLLAAVVAYHDAAKHQLLGVPSMTLLTYGAVSSQTAEAMAIGARSLIKETEGLSKGLIYGLSSTGVAGPDLQEGKPVGQVHLGFAIVGAAETVSLQLFGTRDEIRLQATIALFQTLLEQMQD